MKEMVYHRFLRSPTLPWSVPKVMISRYMGQGTRMSCTASNRLVPKPADPLSPALPARSQKVSTAVTKDNSARKSHWRSRRSKLQITRASKRMIRLMPMNTPYCVMFRWFRKAMSAVCSEHPCAKVRATVPSTLVNRMAITSVLPSQRKVNGTRYGDGTLSVAFPFPGPA